MSEYKIYKVIVDHYLPLNKHKVISKVMSETEVTHDIKVYGIVLIHHEDSNGRTYNSLVIGETYELRIASLRVVIEGLSKSYRQSRKDVAEKDVVPMIINMFVIKYIPTVLAKLSTIPYIILRMKLHDVFITPRLEHKLMPVVKKIITDKSEIDAIIKEERILHDSLPMILSTDVLCQWYDPPVGSIIECILIFSENRLLGRRMVKHPPAKMK